MKIKNPFLFTILTISSIIMVSYFVDNKCVQKDYTYINGTGGEYSSPVSLKMYEIIEELSTEYKIPKYIAYNVAYLETKYRGPFHWNYNPYLTSYAGAEGPMQIMPSTANGIHKSYIDREILRTDLRLNIETSMKLLSILYDKYGNWSLVCGYYNTGHPIVNEYASFCSNNTNYVNNWVLP
jgi:soluble lytic murein transglycosylase-like protein